MRRWFTSPFVVAFLLSACAAPPARPMGMRMDEGMMERHMAPIPAEYAGLTNPIAPDAASLARGKVIYEANCAACHGASGLGDGPAAESLDPPPAPIAHTSQMLSEAYLFYRVSEGGNFAPFNSAMPAWKEKLREDERWAVINYIRSLEDEGMMGNMPNGMRNDDQMTPGDGILLGGGMTMLMLGGMMLSCVVALAALAAVAVGLIWVARRASGNVRPESPLDILKRRYARGEISAEQFETMKRQLDEK